MHKKLYMFAVILLLALSGCAHKEKTVHNEPNKPPESGEVSENEKESLPKYSYPLTGAEAKEPSENRSVAVMINNYPAARPQSGLAEADIVYEVLAEGDITRFLAIYQSEKPKRIGPVRSARDYFIHLAKGYSSLYIAHGYSPEARKMLSSGYIDNINGMQYDGTLFKRSSDRKPPHNSYISYENILKGAKLKHYQMNTPPSGLDFMNAAETMQVHGQDAKNVRIHYSHEPLFNVEYEYNADSEKYKRFSGGEQTADLESKRPVLLDNLFIVETKHKVIDGKGRRDINLTSGGKAYLFQKGKYREVEWRNIDGRILPFENGEKVKFVPGKTWINIVPNLNIVGIDK
ncbi:lipoprotein YerB [Heyndrickxia shackletonii]|uniref:Lipoprotein YerB n=1 Tax=Heyndrickxia shackletonii TaxID=157838 RepID=A0A0Q3WQX5_9BACI|nr:DUF3048 domain-containing protein [Heyndrickxia shackletonii]KQL51419.1 lipoprotein YerB [Heyndrickxia shackletonii]NEZ00765.1 DUF3048 domain-containing protein [Heyndrickxia shackletonii]